MTFHVDPEIAVALAARTEMMVSAELPPVETVFELRAMIDLLLKANFSSQPERLDVSANDFLITAQDGADIVVRWYTKAGSYPGSAIVYVHGGGMIGGSMADYDPLVRRYVQLTGVCFLAVDFRLAPEFSNIGLSNDVLAAMQWLFTQAPTLGIDPGRVAVMGDSGGGGVAAGAAIMARDQALPLARQILIYPMLDDRNTVPDKLLTANALWSYDHNRISWEAVLGIGVGGADVQPHRSPARLKNFDGLAPAYIEVGELDIFRDESIAYAARMYSAGVSCELHVHPGAPHAFDVLCTDAAVSARTIADRVRVITSI